MIITLIIFTLVFFLANALGLNHVLIKSGIQDSMDEIRKRLQSSNVGDQIKLMKTKSQCHAFKLLILK